MFKLKLATSLCWYPCLIYNQSACCSSERDRLGLGLAFALLLSQNNKTGDCEVECGEKLLPPPSMIINDSVTSWRWMCANQIDSTHGGKGRLTLGPGKTQILLFSPIHTSHSLQPKAWIACCLFRILFYWFYWELRLLHMWKSEDKFVKCFLSLTVQGSAQCFSYSSIAVIEHCDQGKF